MTEENLTQQFTMNLDEVIAGLRETPPRISSKYLYDANGEELFRRIMELDEYYLTRAELEVLSQQSHDIMSAVGHRDLDVVELGAGDGSKTRFLLEAAMDACSDVRYVPIDIAESALNAVRTTMRSAIPELTMEPVRGDYLEGLRSLHASSNRPELILFLGSNIGNYDNEEVSSLLLRIRSCVTEADRLLLGVDLKKDPRVVHRAYNDQQGLTREFNLNLVTRMQRELGASCRPEDFDHYESYDPISGEARSYLVSEVDQVITFSGSDARITMSAGDVILTEISRKFDLHKLQQILNTVGWSTVDVFQSADGGFADLLLAPTD